MANQKQINQMMAQMQRMQQDVMTAQQELAAATVEGSAGGGKVTATVTALGELQRITISPDVVDPEDIETLEDLIVAAVKNATTAGQQMQAERMGAATGGMDLGNLGGLLG